MQRSPSTFAISLPSEPKMLGQARQFVESICTLYNLERSVKHALIMAAGEAFTNIIRHAHRHLPHASLKIQIHFEGGGVVMSFMDEGAPFDIATVPHLEPGEMRIGGRGVFMMRRLMDEVRSHPHKNGRGNTLRMFKRCTSTV